MNKPRRSPALEATVLALQDVARIVGSLILVLAGVVAAVLVAVWVALQILLQ